MSKLSHLHRQVRRFARQGSTSHAWVTLLRMVEALAQSRGQGFHDVRAELERDVPLGPRPDLAPIVEAAAWLQQAHDEVREKREGWRVARRQEKRDGRRTASRQVALLQLEARVGAYNRARPRVGCWGWRRRRAAAGTSGP